MHTMKQDIIERINLLAQEGDPFLFVVNFQGDDAFIQKLSDIDPRECLYDFEGTSNVGRQVSLPSPLRCNGRSTLPRMRRTRRASIS